MSLFSADGIAALEEMAVDEEEQTQQWCTFMSAMTNRTYHFELVYPNGERTAMELERHPRDPMIRFYRGRTWSVRLLRTPDRDGEVQESLEWTPVVPADDGQPRLDEEGNMLVDASNPLVIDVRKDLSFIRRKLSPGESMTGIEFGFQNGHSQTFSGGLYYPENAMKRSLVRAFHEREREVRDGEISTLNRHAGGREVTAGGVGIALEGTSSMVSQVYSGAKFGALQAFVVTFFTGTGTAAAAGTAAAGTAAVAGTAAAGTWTAIGMAWAAAVAGGAWTAAVWSLPVIVPTTVWSSVHSWRHERRELSFTASEKLFEKFSCHRMIGVCDGADLVGRDSVTLFDVTSGRPDRDTLIPISGDVDVISRQPFPAVVPWSQEINNEGNIQCVDPRVWSR